MLCPVTKGEIILKILKKTLACLLLVCLLANLAPMVRVQAADNAKTIVLSSTENADGTYSHTALYNGAAVKEYDYTWHADPSIVHSDVSNSPAEYYTGTKPGNDAVYIAHDIYYYPELPTSGFRRMNYDGEQEWCYYYTAPGYTGYIFSTLPGRSNSLPTSMMHSADEAYQNAVLHITQPGDYIIEGTWHGQIWVDLENYCDDPFTDPTAKVNLILNGVTVNCTVAAGVVFYNVYECDNTWEDKSSWSYSVDTSGAGAVVTLADGKVNNVTGTNIFRILKTQYKSGSSSVQKKRLKIDGSFYSYQSMAINGGTKGTGVLNITAGYEGLNSELHLSVNGGNVNIFSQDDGINVNEDNVSVLTINGGTLHILAGLGSEGDGIDSNGFISVNGGTVITMANPGADSGMDSDFGTYVFGGNVVALGATMDWATNDNSVVYDHATMNLQFSSSRSAGDAIIITDTKGNGIFAYDPDKDEINGSRVRTYTGAIVSCDALTKGESYHVYIGGDVTGTETKGVYDMTTVTAVSNTYRQGYNSGSNTTFSLSGNVNKFSRVGNSSGTTSVTVTPMEGATPVEKTYYLFGYINGSNYACEEDARNMGQYQFVDGVLTATFTQDSYVAVKEADNAAWYMAQSYCTDTECSFYDTTTGAAEKLFVPGGKEVTFTLSECDDGSLRLSYVTLDAQCAHRYDAVVLTEATCQDYAQYLLTCSVCGEEITVSAEELQQQWLYAVPTDMDAAEFESARMYRYRDYNAGGWQEIDTGTVTYVNSWPSGFDKTNSLYTQYNNASKKVTAYNDGSEKLEINHNKIMGYLYYHWCYEGYPYTVATQSGSYNRFHAYYSTKTPSQANRNDPSDDSYRFDDSIACDDSYWYFYVPVYEQSYSTYTLTNAGWTPWSDWSSQAVAASDTRKVEEATLYRYTAAAFGDHNYVNGNCTRCGSVDPNYKPPTIYYLFGYINGENYACEENYEEMGNYRFTDGKLTVTFATDSYVAVKTEGNGSWYMTNGWLGTEVKTATLYNTDVLGTADKLYVPGGVEVTFTLTENSDDTLTLSYTIASSVIPTLTLKYPTVSFEDVIVMNVYYTAANLDNVVEMGLITYSSNVSRWSIDNAEEVIPGYSYAADKQMYVSSTKGIAAKCLGDTMYFAVYAKLTDGTYTYTKLVSYSPEAYAYSQLSTGSADIKPLVVAMLKYGAAAQTFFGHNTDALVDRNLTAAQLALIEGYRADMMASVATPSTAKQGKFVANGGITRKYPTVSFEGAFEINYYCVPANTPVDGVTMYYWNQADYDAASVLTAGNATAAVPMDGTDSYQAAVKGIAAKDLDKGIYVAFVYSDGTTTYSSGVLAYSIGTYCNASVNGNAGTLAKATAVYGYYAKQTFY